jgi:hypothetical protein
VKNSFCGESHALTSGKAHGGKATRNGATVRLYPISNVIEQWCSMYMMWPFYYYFIKSIGKKYNLALLFLKIKNKKITRFLKQKNLYISLILPFWKTFLYFLDNLVVDFIFALVHHGRLFDGSITKIYDILIDNVLAILTPKGPRVFWCKTTQNYPF